MQKVQDEGYQVAPFPIMWRFAVDSARLNSKRNYMVGLLEFDVTQPRRVIETYITVTGETLSFTVFIVHCLSNTIAHHKQVQAIPDWRGRLSGPHQERWRTFQPPRPSLFCGRHAAGYTGPRHCPGYR